MVRAVIFDLGGVVFGSPLRGIAGYEKKAGLAPGSIGRVITENPDSNAWARLECGELSVDDFCAEFEAEALAAGLELDARAVLAALYAPARPEMLAALRVIREHGYSLAAITNTVEPPASRGDDYAAVLELFDVVVESGVEGIRKPDVAIYELALARLGLSAAECVFLDDLGRNLKPARALGMATIKVADPLDALEELGALLDLDLVRAAA